MIKVAVIDYGMSNLLSIARALEKNGANVTIATTPEQVIASDRLVLPGVGAFPDAMQELAKRNLVEPILNIVKQGKPFLGICLGMQMMLTKGFEKKETHGINLISGSVVALPKSSSNGVINKIPHMGWSSIEKPAKLNWSNTIFKNVNNLDPVYFVHSYCAELEHEENILSLTQFGDMKFPSAIYKDNCYGTQFHPEKSGELGLTILQSFLTL